MYYLLLALIFLLLIVIWLFSLQLLQLLAKIYNLNVLFHSGTTNKSQTKKRIAITIDDVPYKFGNLIDTHIFEICKVLQENKSCATLLMIGKFLKEKVIPNSELHEQLISFYRNNIISFANHGNSETAHYKLNKEEIKKEITECEDLFLEIFSQNDLKNGHENDKKVKMEKFYRPGHGFFTKDMVDQATELNYKVLLGNVYPHDPQVPFSIINFINIILTIFILRIVKKETDFILILHDRPWTASLLKILLPFFKKFNYEFVMVSEMFEKNL